MFHTATIFLLATAAITTARCASIQVRDDIFNEEPGKEHRIRKREIKFDISFFRKVFAALITINNIQSIIQFLWNYRGVILHKPGFYQKWFGGGQNTANQNTNNNNFNNNNAQNNFNNNY
uniref:Uncharacterized protein n=1 Tax=Clastoptera arizonana TaxID=38151 RepID=A0A1B6CWI6_9HEMI